MDDRDLDASILCIIDMCNSLKANEIFSVDDFGETKELSLHITKDSYYNKTIDEDLYNLVQISIFKNNVLIKDTGDIFVTDGSLYDELKQLYNYREDIDNSLQCNIELD